MNNFAQKLIDAGKPLVATLADLRDLELLREDELVYSETTTSGAPVWGLTEKGREFYADHIPTLMLPATQRVVEVDPNGVDQHQGGAKLDAGKPRTGLVLGDFANALLEVSKVGTHGANKYTEHGWLSVPNGIERYTDAMQRHWLYEASGQKFDTDLPVLHAAQVAWNALARLELMLRAEK